MTVRVIFVFALAYLSLLGATNLLAGPPPETIASSSVGHGGGEAKSVVAAALKKVSFLSKTIVEEAKLRASLYRELCQFEDRERQIRPTVERLDFCEKFAEFAILQILKMSTDDVIANSPKLPEVWRQEQELANHKAIDFHISAVPLTDREGNDVDAISPDHFYESGITFDQGVRERKPEYLVYLWVHEMGHKLKFYDMRITDRDPLGPYTHAAELLDTLAWGMARYATEKGFIWDEFNFIDFFECKTFRQGEDSPISSFSSGSIRKYKLNRQTRRPNYNAYTARFDGENPFFHARMPAPILTRTELVLKLEIVEPNASSAAFDPARETAFILSRVTKGEDGRGTGTKVVKDPVIRKGNLIRDQTELTLKRRNGNDGDADGDVTISMTYDLDDLKKEIAEDTKNGLPLPEELQGIDLDKLDYFSYRFECRYVRSQVTALEPLPQTERARRTQKPMSD